MSGGDFVLQYFGGGMHFVQGGFWPGVFCPGAFVQGIISWIRRGGGEKFSPAPRRLGGPAIAHKY